MILNKCIFIILSTTWLSKKKTDILRFKVQTGEFIFKIVFHITEYRAKKHSYWKINALKHRKNILTCSIQKSSI